MKINEQLQAKFVNLYQQRKTETGNSAQVPRVNTDKVEISQDAKDLQQLIAKTLSLPDVRAEKVGAIKSRLGNGTYHVAPDKVAAKMAEMLRAQEGRGS